MRIKTLIAAGVVGLLAPLAFASSAHASTVHACATVTHAGPHLTSVTVQLHGDGPCGVSLTSFTTDGPTWQTSGVQTALGHVHVTLTADKPTADLEVADPPCFGQVDVTLDDGTVVVPHFPDVTTPGLVDHWNGGKPCETESPTPTPDPSPSDTPTTTSPTPSNSPTGSSSTSRPPTSPPATSSPSGSVSTPATPATHSPSVTPSHSPSPAPKPELPHTGAPFPVGQAVGIGLGLIGLGCSAILGSRRRSS